MRLLAILCIGCALLVAACGAGNTANGKSNSPEPAGAKPTVKQPEETEDQSPEMRAATVWIVVDGMTKVQGIT